MNIYENQIFAPMMMSKAKKPFDDKDYLYEIKFDGIRALIFVEPEKITIKSRNNNVLNDMYPELLKIKNTVKKKVIFDGEIVNMTDGRPSFNKLKERAILKDKFKIDYYSKNYPVVYIAFDILYEDKDLTDMPLIERKKILNKYKNTKYFIKSEYIEEKGKDLYKFISKNRLEGIVAKKMDSIYKINKRTKAWIKIKKLTDEDYYICGYKDEHDKNMANLLLGKKKKNGLEYIGVVAIGKKNPEFTVIKDVPKDKNPLVKKSGYVNIIAKLQCTIAYEKTRGEKLRQAVFKGLRY